ncbi:MAG: hypothetical protein ACI8S6_005771, partial [Myxococcota bacterium]
MDTRLAASRFMARYPHPDLAIISLRAHGDCHVLSCESRLFIKTDSMSFLVGLGPVVIDHAGVCFPFLSTHTHEEAVQHWRDLAGLRPSLLTDTTANVLSFAAAHWVLKNVGWGLFKRMHDVDRDCEHARQSASGALWSREQSLSAGESSAGESFEGQTAPGQPLHVRVFFSDAILQLGSQQSVVRAGGGHPRRAALSAQKPQQRPHQAAPAQREAPLTNHRSQRT